MNESTNATLAPATQGPNAHSGFPRIAAGLMILALAIAGGLIAGGMMRGAHWRDGLLKLGDSLAPAAMPGKSAANAAPRQLWTCSMHPQVIRDEPGPCPICHMPLTPLKTEAEPAASAPTETPAPVDEKRRKIKYYWDPMMNPPYISEKPGTSPMGMDLVPVYEDAPTTSAPSTIIAIDPAIVQNMGVRTAVVAEGSIRRTVRAVGYLDEAQPGIHDVNLRVSGWIEKLYADTEGMRVHEGAPLFDLYSPELQVAIGELINARKSSGAAPGSPQSAAIPADSISEKTATTLLGAAVQKLRQMGLDAEQIEALAALDRPPATVSIKSPVSGDVLDKSVVDGSAVKAGDRIMRVVQLGTLWLDAQVYERQLAAVRVGQRMTATVESEPGKTFAGKVIFIHPLVDAQTRTALVRMEIDNAAMALRPGMFASATIDADASKPTRLVPREAVIDTGERQIAFVVGEAGHFEPRAVKMGESGDDGMVQILEGLEPGEEIVTSGQFLLDSESRMREAIQKFLSEKKSESK